MRFSQAPTPGLPNCSAINYSGSPRAHCGELARTPLLLTLLCIVSGRDARVPRNRIELYRRAPEILLIEWNKTKPLLRGHRLKIKPRKELQFLENVAYQLFVEDRFVFTFTELEQIISETIHLLDTWLPRSKQIGPSDMIHIVESDQGLWIRRSGNCYSFSHLTLQEFLTARHIHNAGLQDYILRSVSTMICGEKLLLCSVATHAAKRLSTRSQTRCDLLRVDWSRSAPSLIGSKNSFLAVGCLHSSSRWV